MTLDFNNTRRNNFLGHDNFIWWIGIVESRLDPLNLGRCQVRIKGLHTEDTTQINTGSLPWAQPMFPVNSSFSTPTTLKEGDMVTGFFLDGDAAQYPVILGMFHGIPEDAPNASTGFNDQRTSEQLFVSPRKPKSISFPTGGGGAALVDNTSGFLYPDNLNEPTTDRLCRNESIDKTIVQSKIDSVVTVQKAVSGTWTEPKTPYGTMYPFNQVLGTESGHYMEFDDTPGAERTHLYHRSGTFSEIHPSGTKVDKITRDKYTVVMKDDHMYVMGTCAITVQGNAEVYVQKDCYLKVDGNLTQLIKKDWKVVVGGNVTFGVEGSITSTSIGPTTIIGNIVELKENAQ